MWARKLDADFLPDRRPSNIKETRAQKVPKYNGEEIKKQKLDIRYL